MTIIMKKWSFKDHLLYLCCEQMHELGKQDLWASDDLCYLSICGKITSILIWNASVYLIPFGKNSIDTHRFILDTKRIFVIEYCSIRVIWKLSKSNMDFTKKMKKYTYNAVKHIRRTDILRRKIVLLAYDKRHWSV